MTTSIRVSLISKKPFLRFLGLLLTWVPRGTTHSTRTLRPLLRGAVVCGHSHYSSLQSFNICITHANFISSVGAVNVLGFLDYLSLAHVLEYIEAGNDIRRHAIRLRMRQDPHRYLSRELQRRSLHLQTWDNRSIDLTSSALMIPCIPQSRRSKESSDKNTQLYQRFTDGSPLAILIVKIEGTVMWGRKVDFLYLYKERSLFFRLSSSGVDMTGCEKKSGFKMLFRPCNSRTEYWGLEFWWNGWKGDYWLGDNLHRTLVIKRFFELGIPK